MPSCDELAAALHCKAKATQTCTVSEPSRTRLHEARASNSIALAVLAVMRCVLTFCQREGGCVRRRGALRR